MKNLASLLPVLALAAFAACGKQQPTTAPATQQQPAAQEKTVPAPPVADDVPAPPASTTEATPATPPAETVTETDDAQESTDQTASTTVQPGLRLGSAAGSPPASERFKEGTHYKKIVPAQPTTVAPGKVEVAEVFWYGCSHCFALDPAIDAWRNKGKPQYVEFVRIPAMWNDATRMHARLFYTVEALGKLDALHALIFREIHVNNDPLNSLDKVTAFLKQHGVSAQEFQKTFASFAVESKLQRADFLNRRYRVQSVPMFVVNGKYTTDVSDAGGEPQLFEVIDELAAHEHGG